MKKSQILFAVFAMIVSGCAIPLAHVEAQQEFPRATANGCNYSGQSGNGNHARVNGLAYDAGDFFIRAAVGNMNVINACTDLDYVHGLTDLYDTYKQNELQGDDGLKKEVDDNKAALGELDENVMRLGKLVMSQPVSGKPGKGNKQEAPTVAPAPAASSVPTASAAPIDPNIVGKILAARSNPELAGVLRAAIGANPTDAVMFNGLAAKIEVSPAASFPQNQKTLAEAFGRKE